jgi:hypothetical protein
MKNRMAYSYALRFLCVFFPLSLLSADELTQRKISPREVRKLEARLAGLPKGDVCLLFWPIPPPPDPPTTLSPPPPSFTIYPGSPPITATEEVAPIKKVLALREEEDAFVEQLRRIFRRCGYHVKLDGISGSGPASGVDIEYQSAAAELATELQRAMTESDIKPTSRDKNPQQHASALLTIWVWPERSAQANYGGR